MVPWSMPSLLMGLHVMHGVLAGINLEPHHQHHKPTSPSPATTHTYSTVSDRPVRDDQLFPRLPHVLEHRVDIRKLVPRKKNLKPLRLMRKMGKDFNSFWMSEKTPRYFLHVLTKKNVDPSLHDQMKNIGLSTVAQKMFRILESTTYSLNDRNTTINASRLDIPESARVMDGVMNSLESWLVHLGSCPVYYKWEDQGLLYWPRFVRRGSCTRQVQDNEKPAKKKSRSSTMTSQASTSSSTCSWPPGMHCIPAREKRLRVLRWTCRQTGVSESLNQLNPYRHWRRRTLDHVTLLHDILDTLPKERGSNQAHDENSAKRPPHDEEHDEEHDEDHEEEFEEVKHTVESPSNIKDLILQKIEKGSKVNKNNVDYEEKRGDIESQDFRSRGMKSILSRTIRPFTFGHRTRRDVVQQRNPYKTDHHRKGGKRRHKKRKSALRCRWVKISIPVVDDCYCSC